MILCLIPLHHNSVRELVSDSNPWLSWTTASPLALASACCDEPMAVPDDGALARPWSCWLQRIHIHPHWWQLAHPCLRLLQLTIGIEQWRMRRRSPVQTRGRHDGGCVRCGGHGRKVQCGLGDHVVEVVDGASNLERLRRGRIEIRLKEARDADIIMVLCSSLIGSTCQSLMMYQKSKYRRNGPLFISRWRIDNGSTHDRSDAYPNLINTWHLY